MKKYIILTFFIVMVFSLPAKSQGIESLFNITFNSEFIRAEYIGHISDTSSDWIKIFFAGLSYASSMNKTSEFVEVAIIEQDRRTHIYSTRYIDFINLLNDKIDLPQFAKKVSMRIK